MTKKAVVIKLTPKQAKLVWQNADGWLDAGACEDGLEKDENRALSSLCTQILAQITPIAIEDDEDIDCLTAKVEALTDERDLLRECIEPVVAHIGAYDDMRSGSPENPDSYAVLGLVTLGDLRKIARTHKETGKA